MTEEEFHPWLAELGAYVVGALEPDEAQALRRHLEACPVCQAQFAELDSAAGLLAAVPAESFDTDAALSDGAGLPAGPDPELWARLRVRAGLADAPPRNQAAAAPAAAPAAGVPPVAPAAAPAADVHPAAPTATPAGAVHPAAAPADVPPVAAPQSTYTPSPADRAAAPQSTYTPSATPPASPVPRPRHRQRPRVRWPSRAGASAALAGALTAVASGGVAVGLYATSGAESVSAQTVSAVNAADGVSGSVQYHGTDWGSEVRVTLKGVPHGDDCVMYAIDSHGNRSVAGSWWAPYNGSQTATIPGGVAMQASDIRQFVVETTAGEILLTIPAS